MYIAEPFTTYISTRSDDYDKFEKYSKMYSEIYDTKNVLEPSGFEPSQVANGLNSSQQIKVSYLQPV